MLLNFIGFCAQIILLKPSFTRSSTSNTKQPNLEAGKRGRRRISDIKGETTIKHHAKGCETPQGSYKETKLRKEQTLDVTGTSTANISPGSLENTRPGAPHYCEICGKVMNGANCVK